MYRKITKTLGNWKRSPHRKPLILQGVRQCGKTWSILEFGRREYANVAYFNFELHPELQDLFAGDISPEYLLPRLSHTAQETIVPGKTLVVFDEVQLCERAITSLKYFCEMAPQYHIAALGSLLGVASRRKQYSWPVGKVDLFAMHPMDVEEFLHALGHADLAGMIRDSFSDCNPLPAPLHQDALDLYRQYLYTGGMPECVAQFRNTRDYILVRNVQDSIILGYLNDLSKYSTPAEVRKTRLVYNNVTVQLSKKNTRFAYKMLKKGARAAEFENAIEWLSLSGVVSRVYRAEQIRKPLSNYLDIDAFKIYGADTGLLVAKKGLTAPDVLYPTPELDDFKGALAENYVNTQLVANGYETYYWQSDRAAEVDFVVLRDGDIVPIEVKSADNVHAKSLSVYIEKFHPDCAFKLSTKNFGRESATWTIPLYAAFCI